MIAAGIFEFFRNPSTVSLLENLRKGGVRFPDYVAPGGQELKGKTFVITGTLSQPRNFFKRQIEDNGGKVVGSVSAKTDYLLCGADPGSKRDKALKAGVTILDEQGLQKLLG